MTPSTTFVPVIWLLLRPFSIFEVYLPKDKSMHTASLDEITPFSSSEALFHLFTTEKNRNRIGRSQKKKNLTNKCHSYISDRITEQPVSLDKEHTPYRPTNIVIIFTVEYPVSSYEITASSKT